MGRAQGQQDVQAEALVRATVSLPEDELESLQGLAEARGVTRTQVLRQALVSEQYLQELTDKGARILVRGPRRGLLRRRGPDREVVFPQMTDEHASLDK